MLMKLNPHKVLVSIQNEIKIIRTKRRVQLLYNDKIEGWRVILSLRPFEFIFLTIGALKDDILATHMRLDITGPATLRKLIRGKKLVRCNKCKEVLLENFKEVHKCIGCTYEKEDEILIEEMINLGEIPHESRQPKV